MEFENEYKLESEMEYEMDSKVEYEMGHDMKYRMDYELSFEMKYEIWCPSTVQNSEIITEIKAVKQYVPSSCTNMYCVVAVISRMEI